MVSENSFWSDLSMRPHAATEKKPNVSLADLIRPSGSLFGSLYFTVCKNRCTHFLIIPQYSVGSSAVKKAKRDCSFFKFFCQTIQEYGTSNTSK